MIEFSRCARCLRDDREMTLEHVFPEATGGGLVARILCKPCNDALGAGADAKIANHELVQWQRFTTAQEGKSGRYANPVARARNADFLSQEVLYELGPDGGPGKPRLVPYLGFDESTGSFHARGDDLDALVIAVQKAATRRKLPVPTVEEILQHVEVSEVQPRIMREVVVDLARYQIGMAKIAYEIGCVALGETYLDDPVATKLRAAMDDDRDPPPDNLLEDHGIAGVTGMLWLKPEVNDLIQVFERRDDDDAHIAYLQQAGGQLVLVLRLYRLFFSVVTISHDAHKYSVTDQLVIYNDPHSKNCEIETLLQLIARTKHTIPSLSKLIDG